MSLTFTECYSEFMRREQWVEHKFLQGLIDFKMEGDKRSGHLDNLNNWSRCGKVTQMLKIVDWLFEKYDQNWRQLSCYVTDFDNSLNMKKGYAKMTPKYLSSKQKMKMKQICWDLILLENPVFRENSDWWWDLGLPVWHRNKTPK